MTPTEMKALRDRLGLSQTEMGKLLRLKSGARIVGAWERGEREPGGTVRFVYDLLDKHPKLAKEMPA